MRGRRLVLDVGPLRESADFRRLWAGSSLSVIGGQMTAFAVTLQVFRMTHSSIAVGGVGLASGAPLLLLGLFGGAFADAVDRRRLALVTNAGSIVVSALLAAQAFAGLGLLWPLYALARLPPMPPQGGPARPGLAAVTEGLRFVRRTPVLAGIFLADLDAMVLGMPFALFPALDAAHFGGSPQTLGLLSAAPAVGGLAGSALSGPVGQVARPGRALLGAVTVWGAAIAGFGLADALWAALSLLVVAGAADTASVIFRATIVQVATPDRLRGRVTGVDFVVGAGVPQLGNFRAGAVASLTSPAASAVGGGVATFLGACLIRLAVPALARYTPAEEKAD
ncbi:MFS transporter [Actinomadura sp. DC4]|uniref:MFS transporter n=1 Tax=Actinomadura sp. DC4 TaxID=3055069 RepID=UPI0025AF651B|nr:MFS transporter [Actinomadura sp. DC4]MDN3356259.1 MFS transporter [Actinomadura sp. DC4]